MNNPYYDYILQQMATKRVVEQQLQQQQQLCQQYQPQIITAPASVYLNIYNGITISLNTRLDVFFYETNSWCPAKVVYLSNIDMDCQSDGNNPICQKINFSQDINQLIAPLYFYTKSHQNHQILKHEAAKRKLQWTLNAALSSPSVSVSSSSSTSTDSCAYFKRCQQIIQLSIKQQNIFNIHGNRCFCRNCHLKRGDLELYSRGNPLQEYVLPLGWSRFGIKLPQSYIEQNVLSEWHVVYHGTKYESVNDIIESGLILLKPDDFKLDGSDFKTLGIRKHHYQTPSYRTNGYSQQQELFDPVQIFTSPSAIYSSYYSNQTVVDGQTVSIMFQCRQKPGTYCRGQETLGFDRKNAVIDRYIGNEQIEFYTKKNLNIVITGILIKIFDFAEPVIEEPVIKKSAVGEKNEKAEEEEESDDSDIEILPSKPLPKKAKSRKSKKNSSTKKKKKKKKRRKKRKRDEMDSDYDYEEDLRTVRKKIRRS